MSAFRFLIDGVDNSKADFQRLSGRGHQGHEFTDVHRVQPFGFSSTPPKGSHGVGLPREGRHSNGIFLLGGEHPDFRPKDLPDGATALYGANGELVSIVQGAVRQVAPNGATIVVGGVIFKIKDGKVSANVPIYAPDFIIGTV